VLVAALVSLLLKLYLARVTLGTEDVHHWTEFALGAKDLGPIGFYEGAYSAPLNHPPLMGWALLAISWLGEHFVSFAFWIRVPASLSDVITSLLVFELVKRRVSIGKARAAGVAVALSPMLVMVSGFHGNTDSVFVMLSLLSLFCLVNRRIPLVAGLAIGLAVSIKLTPVVFIPMLAVLAWRRGMPSLVRFVIGGGIAFVLLWVPVILKEWPAFNANVLGYIGIANRQWGVPLLMEYAHASPELMLAFITTGRLVVVAVCSLLPALAVWLRPDCALAAFTCAIAAFVVLTPAFGIQYLVWPLAAAYLSHFGLATLYNMLVSFLGYAVYTRWAMAPVDAWNVARGQPFTPPELGLIVAAWAALLMVTVAGAIDLMRSGGSVMANDASVRAPAGTSR
jgi:4-amino-4-deoxy-L-arabinose transferase-like glycosyltransferase